MATHQSPKGRPVEIVCGRGGDVSERGQQIINLGAAMSEAHGLLTKLVDQGADMEGKAVDRLREVSEEVTSELAKAADLYSGVGPHVKAYGDELTAVRLLMDVSVPDANSYWTAYQQRLSDWQDASSSPVRYPAGSGDDIEACTAAERAHADAVETAECDKNDAYLLWKGAADDFDAEYDRWETAFDAAVEGVRSSTSGQIKDSWKDNLDGFVDFALDVLAVAGLVLAVLALVVGGPLVALAALAVGVLALAGTLWQYSRGDAALWEVGLAVVGVLPFGAFGEFASGGFGAGMRAWTGLSRGGMSLGDDALRWGMSLRSTSPMTWVSNMRDLGRGAGFASGIDDIVSTVITGQDNSMWTVIGALGTTGEQVTYAVSAVGQHYATINTVVDGVKGGIGLATSPERLLWPTY